MPFHKMDYGYTGGGGGLTDFIYSKIAHRNIYLSNGARRGKGAVGKMRGLRVHKEIEQFFKRENLRTKPKPATVGVQLAFLFLKDYLQLDPYSCSLASEFFATCKCTRRTTRADMVVFHKKRRKLCVVEFKTGSKKRPTLRDAQHTLFDRHCLADMIKKNKPLVRLYRSAAEHRSHCSVCPSHDEHNQNMLQLFLTWTMLRCSLRKKPWAMEAYLVYLDVYRKEYKVYPMSQTEWISNSLAARLQMHKTILSWE